MTNHKQTIVRMRKATLAVIAATAMVVLSLALIQVIVQARFSASGANGCGTFLNALGDVQDGDTIVQMIPLKSTEGAIISKNVAIQGGWLPTSNCLVENEVFTTTADLIAAGFQFQAPFTRSILAHDQGPVLTIDPSVISVTVQHVELQQFGITTTLGGGVSGVITGGAQARLENLMITDSTVVNGGGGVYFEVRGGSRLVISDSIFISNTVNQGGGGSFEIRVYDNSEVIIHNTQTLSSTASGNGGGGRIIVESGYVTVTNSSFYGNQSGAAGGNNLSIEGTSAGPAYIWLNDNLIDGGLSLSGTGLIASGNDFNQIYLPMALKNYPPTTKQVQITGITVDGSNNYVVSFQTFNYTPQLPGDHIHFFFDTVPPDQAGVPGSGPWEIYGQPSPFTGYAVSDRPVGANNMCALVANPDHSIILNSGNCISLP